jgi:glycerol kinase
VTQPARGGGRGRGRPLLLALDQGGHASRAILFDDRGRIVAVAKRPVATRRVGAHRVEHDPEEMVASCGEAIASVLAAVPRSTRIEAAGLATQRSSLVCWDRRSGEALSPVLSWQDRRTHVWLRRLGASAARVHRRTGLVLSPHYGASKLRWCQDHLPAVRRAGAAGRLAWGPLASFLTFRLLAERPHFVDPVHASRTLLWSLRRNAWDHELLALFGLPAAPLPAIVPNLHAFGTLAASGRTIPLRLVIGDQPAALFSPGRLEPDTAHLNVGTGAFVQRPCPRPLWAANLLTGIVLASGRGSTYALEGTVNGAGSAIAWATARLGVAPRAAEQRMPGWLAAGITPPLFLNGISGLGAPFWVPDLRSRFVGAGSAEAKLVAVVESIAFLAQANLDAMGRRLPPPRRLRITGGFSALDGLCRRMADLSGLVVERPHDPEATARGVAWLLAANPAGWREAVPPDRFAPSGDPALRDRYRRWRRALGVAIAGARRR